MNYIPTFQKKYSDEVIPALMKEFGYKSKMEVPKIQKIVINQGIGKAVADRKLIENAVNELSIIAGQKALPTYSKKDISNFKLRKGVPIGVKVTLRRKKMYEFLERLISASLPRIRDFQGLDTKFDKRGNYTFGISEQIIFPEIEIDKISQILGMNITIVTTAKTDEEGFSLLKEFGIPFKK
ncbi:MAG: 50S ribosomal protein L5 [Bacteroidales bacterium]|nr:50S ribosomal protein L5 [Bacteroidales bacterium]NLK81877.1 50S ribosomal protein L5 [Bacteroidales bacterium]